MRIRCLAQEYKRGVPDRARSWSVQSGVQCTNLGYHASLSIKFSGSLGGVK